MTSTAPIDALALGTLWRGLAAAANEGGVILERTAYSEAVREARDFSVAIFDRNGQMIAQGDFSPGHLGSMPGAIRHILDHYAEADLHPGDVIAFNDPWMGSGHLPDWLVCVPFFHQGHLAGYAASFVHMIDVGGAAPGSQQVVGITDNYQEGIRFRPVKLWRMHEPQKELFSVIASNVRLPDKLIGDLKASRNGCVIAGKRVEELIERFGWERFNLGCEALLDESEQAVRTAISEIPDGTYRAVDHMDDCGPDTPPVRFEVTIEISGNDMSIDFSGSDPQTASGINSVENYTKAYCYFAIKAMTHRHTLPQNAGSIRPIGWSAPVGSVLNSQPPAGNGARAIMQQRIVDLLFQALERAIPDRVLAPSSHWANPVISGKNPATNEPFLFYDVIVGGFGGRRGQDGVEAMSSSFNVNSIPTEVNEHSFPVVVERYELIPDSAGAGQWRGGHGVRKDIRVLGADLQLSNLAERQRQGPPGIAGGQAGEPGATILNPGTEQERVLHWKGTYPLISGDIVSQRVCGAAGYGDPRRRSAEAVGRDIRRGLLSPERARQFYDTDVADGLGEDSANR